jgi:ABC-type antimicrobial peptide transport system permease subunit
MTILSAFAAVALVLSAIGLYGVMSSSVSQTRRELAVRIALGADTPRLLRQVLSQAVVLTAAGIVIGSAAALETTRLMGYLLYQVGPRDPLAFGSAFVIVSAASLVACAIPAWRATHTDPLYALRQ